MAQKRRGNNEGTAPYQMKDGRWRADVTIGTDPITGKTKRRPVYGKTAAECSAKRRELIRNVEDGQVAVEKTPSLQQWLEHWLEKDKKPELMYNTWQAYRRVINNHIAGTKLARTQLEKITADQVESLYSHLRTEKELKATSVERVHAVLSASLKDAYRKSRVPVNPMTKVKKPKENADEQFEPKLLTEEDAKKLIEKAEELPLEQGVRWMVALTYGPRQSEVLGLGWDCVDFDRGQIDLKRKLYPRAYDHGCVKEGQEPVCDAKNGKAHLCPQRTGGGLYFGVPKSKAGTRSYPMPPQLQKMMQALWAKQVAIAEQEGNRRQSYTDPNGTTVDLVFCQRNGRPYQASNDSRAWKAFLLSAGVDPVRLHDARHTSATMLLEMGVQPRVVMELMGWSQVSMLTRYQHVIDNVKKSTAEQVGAALWGTGASQ